MHLELSSSSTHHHRRRCRRWLRIRLLASRGQLLGQVVRVQSMMSVVQAHLIVAEAHRAHLMQVLQVDRRVDLGLNVQEIRQVRRVDR